MLASSACGTRDLHCQDVLPRRMWKVINTRSPNASFIYTLHCPMASGCGLPHTYIIIIAHTMEAGWHAGNTLIVNYDVQDSVQMPTMVSSDRQTADKTLRTRAQVPRIGQRGHHPRVANFVSINGGEMEEIVVAIPDRLVLERLQLFQTCSRRDSGLKGSRRRRLQG